MSDLDPGLPRLSPVTSAPTSPSRRSRLGMVALSVLPCLASVAVLVLGFSVPDMTIIVAGIAAIAICAALIIVAQLSPRARLGAMIIMGVLALLVLVALALLLVLSVLLWAACSGV